MALQIYAGSSCKMLNIGKIQCWCIWADRLLWEHSQSPWPCSAALRVVQQLRRGCICMTQGVEDFRVVSKSRAWRERVAFSVTLADSLVFSKYKCKFKKWNGLWEDNTGILSNAAIWASLHYTHPKCLGSSSTLGECQQSLEGTQEPWVLLCMKGRDLGKALFSPLSGESWWGRAWSFFSPDPRRLWQ